MTLYRNPETTRAWQARSRKPMKRGEGPTRTGFRLIKGGSDGATVVPFPQRKPPRDTIPAKVRALVRARDYGLCVHCSQPADHQHHRRIKGMGGSSDAHANCPCVIVSLCGPCHEFVHRNRLEAEAEGLIIPRATPRPWLLPVLVHGPGSGSTAWPSCDGRWLRFEPDGGDVA